MVLDYYGLREQPFGVTPNPRYLYLSPSHREALASLVYGIESGRGFLALIAPPGMGKTTLLFQLLDQLGNKARTVFLFQNQCASHGLLRSLMADLGVSPEQEDEVVLQARLNEILIEELKARRKFVLVVDEAQNLDDSALEFVRMLSNFETPREKLMQIILAGQPQLADKLARPSMVQLRQRISMLIRLRPLAAVEIGGYVEHRLRMAGYEGPPLFSGGALNAVASLSGGIPRNINNICFNALSLSYAGGLRIVDSGTVRDVAVDLDLSSFAAQSAPPPAPAPMDPAPVPNVHRRRSCRSDGWAVLLDRVSASPAQPYSITRMEKDRRRSKSWTEGSHLTEALKGRADGLSLRMVN
jgi:general secretion pathway protein A